MYELVEDEEETDPSFSSFFEQENKNRFITIKIFRNLYFQPGAIAFFTPEFDYSPFLLMSINL